MVGKFFRKLELLFKWLGYFLIPFSLSFIVALAVLIYNSGYFLVVIVGPVFILFFGALIGYMYATSKIIRHKSNVMETR